MKPHIAKQLSAARWMIRIEQIGEPSFRQRINHRSIALTLRYSARKNGSTCVWLNNIGVPPPRRATLKTWAILHKTGLPLEIIETTKSLNACKKIRAIQGEYAHQKQGTLSRIKSTQVPQ